LKQNKNRKRVGRGNSSGHGTYSTRGLKGQKSRSGVSGLKRLGMKKQVLSIPKKRGFTSYQKKAQPVTLAQLNRIFKDGAVVNPQSLIRLSAIRTLHDRVKILAQGTLTLKNLKCNGVTFSAGAREQIEKNGGSIS
jgi:large subunit ribosomal protein L15